MSGRDIVSEHDTVKGGKALESATTKVTAWRLYVIDLHGSDCRTTTWLRVTSWLRSRRQSLGSTDTILPSSIQVGLHNVQYAKFQWYWNLLRWWLSERFRRVKPSPGSIEAFAA